MQKRRAKQLVLPRFDLRKTGVLIGGTAVAALLVMLCITVVMRSNIQSQYTQARNETGEELYTQLYMLCQTYDQLSVPGQDIENVVIPLMEDYYLAAQTVNDVMSNAFGQRYSVLSQDQISAMDSAFDAIDAAFRGGKTTEEAQNAMQKCVDTIQILLESRFRDGVIQSA